VAETKRGVELEEATVKQITGSDTISARAPYGKPFSYRPQFKLWLSTNHKPEIPDGSEAIWDRLKLVPFNQRFDGKKADQRLPQKLREELSGILLWAVQRCVDWYQNGLGSAPAVEAATAAYRAETDVVERFFDDECVFGPEEIVTRKGLFAAWQEWCDENGEFADTQNKFTRAMREKGVMKNFEEKKIKGEWHWKGVGIAKNVPPRPSDEKLPPAQKSCKDEGGESSGGNFSEDSPNFSGNDTHVGGFPQMDEKLPPEAKTSPQGVTAPLRWTEDQVEWEYIPVEESE